MTSKSSSGGKVPRLKFLSRWTKRDWLDFFTLLVLVCMNGIITYFWLIRDSSPLFSDEAYYMYASLRYYDLFTNPSLSFFKDFILVNEFRPPFRLLLVVPFYGIFGKSIEVAIQTNLIFMFILLGSTYLLCRHLFSREVGLLAAFIVSTTPLIFSLAHNFLSDLPLAAMVTLSIYLLVKTQHFTNRRYSYLFGLVLGLNLLIKLECLMFLLFPLLYIICKADLFRLKAFLKFLIKSPISTAAVIISGGALGRFLYAIAELNIWPGNDKFGTPLLLAFVLIGIVIVSFVWVLIAITVAFLSKSSKNEALKKYAFTLLSLLLLLIYLFQYRSPQENLLAYSIIIFLLGFFIANFLFLKPYLRSCLTNLRAKQFSENQWLNLMRSTSVTMLSTLWWYIPAGRRVIPFAIYNPLLPKENEGGHANLLGWDSISYYFMGLLNQQIYIFFWFLLFAIILIVWQHRSGIKSLFVKIPLKSIVPNAIARDRKDIFIFILWLVIPYIVLSMSHVKNSRYVTPYIPVIAIIIAYGIFLLKPWWKKSIAIGLVFIVGLSQLFLFSFGTPELPQQVVVDTPLGEIMIFGQVPLGRHQYNALPVDDDWRMEEILGDIERDTREQPTVFTSSSNQIDIGTITGSHNLHWENLRLIALLNDYPFEFYTGTSFYEQKRFYDSFTKFDYMIIFNQTIDKNSEWVKDYIDENQSGYLSRDFLLLNSYKLPDDSTINVYKRTAASTDYRPPETLPDLV